MDLTAKHYRLSDGVSIFKRQTAPPILLSMIDMGRKPTFEWSGLIVDSARVPKNIRLLSGRLYQALSASNGKGLSTNDLPEAFPAILTMVWDGLLEVMCDGIWISGDFAIDRLGVLPSPVCFSIDKQTAQSWKSIRMACASGLNEREDIVDLLYCYGCLPVNLIPEESKYADAVERANEIMCAAGWRYATLTSQWYRWQAQTRKTASANFKLYVGLNPSDICNFLPPLADCIADSGALSWKCSSTGMQALRPDCVCIYFDSAESMIVASTELENAFRNVPIRVVPLSLVTMPQMFTTWGVDPDSDYSDIVSWRTWIANLVADSILLDANCIDAKGADWKKVAFALCRTGIDPFRWISDPVVIHNILTPHHCA